MIAGFAYGALGLALGAGLIAGFVRGLAGFGLAILLVPVLGLAVPPSEAVVTGNWLGLMIGLLGWRRQAAESERSAYLIGGLALLAIPLGVIAIGAVGPALGRLLIALIALGAFLAVLLPQRPADHAPGTLETAATGLASGVLTGFAGMPGPPVVPYYLRRQIAPAVARASMMMVFLITQGAGVVLAALLGHATWRELALATGLLPAVMLGNALGGRAFGRVDAKLWRIIAGAVLGAAAIAALAKLLQA